jgi:hypothetical protein
MSFYKTFLEDGWAIVRGPGRILYADEDQQFPDTLDDIIDLVSYDAQTGWNDLGATKGGVNLQAEFSEEVTEIDYETQQIISYPQVTQINVSTNISEATLENLQFVLGGSDIQDNEPIDERTISIGTPRPIVRRLAILIKNSFSEDDLIRAFIFKRAIAFGSQSTFSLNKTGDNITYPISWKCLPDKDERYVHRQIMSVIETYPFV